MFNSVSMQLKYINVLAIVIKCNRNLIQMYVRCESKFSYKIGTITDSFLVNIMFLFIYGM